MSTEERLREALELIRRTGSRRDRHIAEAALAADEPRPMDEERLFDLVAETREKLSPYFIVVPFKTGGKSSVDLAVDIILQAAFEKVLEQTAQPRQAATPTGSSLSTGKGDATRHIKRVWLSCERCSKQVRSDFHGDPPAGWSQFGTTRFGGHNKGGLANWCSDCTAKQTNRAELETTSAPLKKLADNIRLLVAVLHGDGDEGKFETDAIKLLADAMRQEKIEPFCEKTPNSTYGPSGSNMSCGRRATMMVNGKNYCTQHGNRAIRRAAVESGATSAGKDGEK